MVKRKSPDSDQMDGDHTVPLPIQTFLWRQTSPFIRGKLGKLCEASCVSFERVLVQNILHGLSPAMTEAVQSTSRWTLIQAALPHIIHCCAAVLEQRKLKNQDQKFDSNETKILYTLHWIILDAASECEDMENEKPPKHRVHRTYDFSIETIQLFVYMFAPLMKTIHEPDLQTLKLENGLRLWQPLWDHRQPTVAAFSASVKPKRTTLKASRNIMRVNFNTANIYVGKGTSTDDIYLGPESFPASRCSVNEPASPHAPLARLSDICALSTTETQSTSVEIICEVCNQVMVNRNGELACKCGVRPVAQRSGSHPTIKPSSPIDKDYITKQLESAAMQPMRDHPEEDVLSASFFDVAVLRCLFCPQWSEDGVYWGLRYIHQRLLEICDDMNRVEYVRERSKSLPTIEIPPPFSPPASPSPPSPTSPTKRREDEARKDRRSSPTQPTEHRKEPAFKRRRVAELKHIFEGKVKQLCRRESSEQFDLSDSHSNKSYKGDESGHSSPDYNHHLTLNGTDGGGLPSPQRPNSALAKLPENEEDSFGEERSESGDSGSDIVRRKSMPALRRIQKHHHGEEEDDDNDSTSSGRRPLLGKDAVARTMSLKPELLQKPIITITEDSPDPTPSPSWLTCKRPSLASERSDRSDVNPHRPLTLQRSLTDSNISYSGTEAQQEVPGSVHYITKDGQMNYVVILQAVHDVAKQDCSPQVCGVLLNLLNCLLDLGTIEKHKPPKKKLKLDEEPITPRKKSGKDHAMPVIGEKEEKRHEETKKERKKTCHNMAMRTIVRIFRSMGCPHGCTGTDSFRGTIGDHLRLQSMNCLTRLYMANKPQFKKYITGMFIKQPLQEVVDFLHALLVFCADPGCSATSPLSSVPKKGHDSGSGGKTPYSNNFGEPIGGGTSVDSIIIGHILKPLTTRFVDSRKDLNTNDNIMLYCDIRQFLNYTKETRGSTFRRVALSGLLEAVDRTRPKEKHPKTTKIIRRTHSITSESGDERETRTSHVSSASEDTTARSRRSLFRRKTRRCFQPQVLPPHGGASDSEILEDTSALTAEKIAPRVSMSANEEDPPSASGTPKRKFSKFNIDGNRRGSLDPSAMLGPEVIIVREKRLVNSYAVKSGMLRFNFMLDCCQPGSIPDPHLLAALLDLEAPVIARAALLLECAHFVNRCNRGEWPNWMKLNISGFRHTGLLTSRGQPSGYGRNLLLQRAAGRLFHNWGEALGNRMHELLNEDGADRFTIIHQIKDEGKKRELKMEEDEEDFLDEATVNHTGSDCPYALKMVACQVLLEISTFLRETYQYLPKAKPPRKDTSFERTNSSRRWSSALGSPGHSERSNSRSSQGDAGQSVGSPSDRKISFAVLGHTERSDSIHSSATSLSMADATVDNKGRRFTAGGKKLLKMRRGSGHNASFGPNRSFKMKREAGTQDDSTDLTIPSGLKRMSSIKSRKVSTQSLRSECSDGESVEADSAGILSDDNQDSPDNTESQDEQDFSKFMPWIKVVVQLANMSNFICDHHNFCHPNCYERQRRSCARLMTAIRKIYNSDASSQTRDKDDKKEDFRKDFLRDKLKRRESMFQPSSPTRRRESTPLLEKIKTDVTLAQARLAAALEGRKEEPKPTKPKDEPPIMKYLTTQVQKLSHSIMSIITKAAPILAEDSFIDMLPVAWELLLENDQELAAAAATVFILASVKAPDRVQEMMIRELHHTHVNQRINAILRFQVLWRFRYQVWPRMEDGANAFFKVPPPSIDFVLPSPTIGLPNLQTVDPPWMPHFKTKMEEVTINQEESKTFVTATTTRRKQQQEQIHRALLAEEDRRRAARENFHMTAVPIMQQAAYEPALHHASEEHEEGEEERVEHVHMHHMQLAQHFFPSCICAAALPIIHLLEDLEVNKEGVAVAEVAEKVIWSCMVEEPQLFLRTFLEKLTNKDKREELVFLLRKLLYHIPELPAQTAHTIFNYLVGLIMFYVRSPTEGGQEAIGEALSILHQVVPSVHDIFFKDLKQTLKKEQCDPMLMITANVPSAKKLIVHDPGDTGIPSQCPIHEDTQFSQILSYSLDFFNIPDEEHSRYFLVDTKTNQMHNPTSYVRDFYFFRRSYYPEFTMVQMDPEQASKTLQKQAFMLKFVEMGKVMFSASIVQSAPTQQIQNHVSFLTEELLKLPSFPRKALEADFGLWGDQWGKELRGLDMMHKYVWVKLMSNMFGSMSSTFTLAGDLPLFLNVLSGAVLLHCEDTAILRVCLATFINASRHFKQVFSTSGYLYIVPTLMKVYSNHQSNPVLCGAIEFAFRQFYTLHRKPFMLQMFGSLAPLLHMTEDPNVFDFTKVDTGALFQLLLALESETNDHLEILDLVEGEKPLMAMDFCYVEDPDTFQVIDAINMCVTVIAYACDSVRAMQMLTILEAVLPHYLKHIKKETNKQDSPGAAREEISVLSIIAVSLRALIISCETLTRNFSGPQRHLETVNSNMKPSANHSNHSPQGIFHDEHSEINSHFHYMEEGRRRHVTAEDEAELTLNEFRRPRNSLLCIVSYFFAHSTRRIRELRRMLADPTFRVPDLLDHKTQNRLAEVTHTLLKVAPYDPATMRCTGLQHYMLDMLPAIDWSNESARPALNLILRRMERLFSKLYKKPILMRHLDWEAASNLLKAIHKTLLKFNYIAHLPHLKTLISVCVNILLADDTLNVLPGDMHGGVPHRLEANSSKVPPPPAFCSAVIKVTTMQMQALGELYTLEQICGGVAVFPTPEKTMNRLINLILPLCIRMGCGRRDTPKMRPFDINFAITCILNGLIPPHKHIVSTAPSATKTQHLSVTDLGRSSTFSLHNRKPLPRENMLNVAFLGLKIMVVCFEKQLTAEWYRIAKYVRDLGHRLLGGIPLWRFLDFVVTVRTPLFLMLQPFIQYRMMKVRCETEQEYFLQHMVHQKMHGFNMPHPKCKGTTLIELATELRHLKEELASTTYEARPRTPTTQPDRTDSLRKSKIVRSSSIEDILEHQMASRLQSLGPLHGSKKYSKTLLTQSSSQSLLRGLPPGESESPVLRRKVSGRITAHEGSRILEKFMRKASIQEDDPPSENVGRDSPSHLQASFLRSSSPRKLQRLQRQASIYQRPHITKQVTIIGTPPEESLLETDEDSEDARETNGAESEDEGPSTPTKSGEDASPDHERAGPSIESADFDPRVHRLQRQDAKSRKTFKIKRHRSTIKGSIIRSATVKTPNLRAPAGRTQSSEPPLGSLERLETQPEEPAEGDSDAVQATNARTNGAARDPEVIIKPVRPSHTRYLPRSKSHDEGGSDVPVSAGTARGRIARQGARLMRSRSPSTSPSRIQPRAAANMTSGMASPQRSGTHTQAYVTKCDSVESLGNEENAALLKPEDKSKSESSLLIYFDDKEEEEKDTCV